MIGGKIIGITRRVDGVTRLTIEGTREKGECSILVMEHRLFNGSSVVLALGDHIWWEGKQAMWTPQAFFNHGNDGCGRDWDVCIPYILNESQISFEKARRGK